MFLAAAPAAKPPTPVSLRIRVRFLPERQGDGAPRLRFTYRFRNTGSEPLHLSWYGYPIQTRRVAPRGRFSIVDAPIRPHRMSPPRPQDFFLVPVGQTVEKVSEEWVGSFVVKTGGETNLEYRLRRPGKVRLSQCYSPEYLSVEDIKKLLPPDAIPFVDRICAPDVTVNIRALPSRRH
jgi:hypothetical protein